MLLNAVDHALELWVVVGILPASSWLPLRLIWQLLSQGRHHSLPWRCWKHSRVPHGLCEHDAPLQILHVSLLLFLELGGRQASSRPLIPQSCTPLFLLLALGVLSNVLELFEGQLL